MIFLNKAQIEARLDWRKAALLIKDAYIATSKGQVVLPPVGHITFDALQADCHIKYGHMLGTSVFVIKVATGFPMNTAQGLPTGNGIVLVLCAETGEMLAVLHDEMRLTDVRTGLGGAIASRTLARTSARNVLVVGTGPQALCQLQAHQALLPPDTELCVWGRDPERARSLASQGPWRVAKTLQAGAAAADIIVTATGAKSAFLLPDWIKPGTHITAVGADAPGKQELAVQLVAAADVRVVDLADQCLDHGEFSHAYRDGLIGQEEIVELGAVLAGTGLGRCDDNQITIADLTGIAAQDIAIARAVLDAPA